MRLYYNIKLKRKMIEDKYIDRETADKLYVLTLKPRRTVEDFCTSCNKCTDQLTSRIDVARKGQGLRMRVQAKEAIAWIDVEGRQGSGRDGQSILIEIFWRLDLVYKTEIEGQSRTQEVAKLVQKILRYDSEI